MIKFLNSQAGLGIIATSFATLAATLISTRIVEREKAKLSVMVLSEIEKLKSANDSERQKIALEMQAVHEVRKKYQEHLLAIRSQAHSQIYPETVTAIKKVWQNVLVLENLIAGALFLDAIFVEADLQNKDTQGFQEALKSSKVLSKEQLDLYYKERIPEIDGLRPFISEDLWRKFFVYRQFCLRFFYVVMDSAKNENFSKLYSDATLNGVITSNLSSEEVSIAKSQKIGRHNYVKELLKYRILKTIREVLSGQIAAEESAGDVLKYFDPPKRT